MNLFVIGWKFTQNLNLSYHKMSSYHNHYHFVNHIYHIFCLPIQYIKRANGFNVVNGFKKLTIINTFLILYTLILVNCIESLQIPDQQAFIGESIIFIFNFLFKFFVNCLSHLMHFLLSCSNFMHTNVIWASNQRD